MQRLQRGVDFGLQVLDAVQKLQILRARFRVRHLENFAAFQHEVGALVFGISQERQRLFYQGLSGWGLDLSQKRFESGKACAVVTQ